MASAQVDRSHYRFGTYELKGRWASYWHQVSEVLEAGGRECLEIGTGPGFVRDRLRALGVNVTVVDIDASLGPDRVGDVRELPCADGEFDVVLCAQVLEHVPWREVPHAVSELHRVCRERAIVSLPQSGVDIGAAVVAPLLGRRAVHARINSPFRFRFDGEHHWQLLSRGKGRRVLRERLSRGFVIEREYTVPELTYHRFFVLRRA